MQLAINPPVAAAVAVAAAEQADDATTFDQALCPAADRELRRGGRQREGGGRLCCHCRLPWGHGAGRGSEGGGSGGGKAAGADPLFFLRGSSSFSSPLLPRWPPPEEGPRAPRPARKRNSFSPSILVVRREETAPAAPKEKEEKEEEVGVENDRGREGVAVEIAVEAAIILLLLLFSPFSWRSFLP